MALFQRNKVEIWSFLFVKQVSSLCVQNMSTSRTKSERIAHDYKAVVIALPDWSGVAKLMKQTIQSRIHV